MSVSICIPTYNGEAFLADTITSVLEQSYSEFEVLVFDDSASKDIRTICENFADDRILYFANETRLGPKGNWNQCLEAAAGKYYKLLPHDDLLLPGALERQVKLLDTRMDVALVFGARHIIKSSGETLMQRKPLGDKARSIDGFDLVRQCLRAGSNIIGEPGNGLIRTELARLVAGYDDSHPYTIDIDFWFRALAHGNGYYTGEFESAFRVHDGSWSAEIGRKQFEDFKGLLETYAENPLYRVDKTTRRLGRLKARLNTQARRLIFKATKGR